MDATRAVIRKILAEAEELDFSEEFLPGDKGMYLEQAGRWVTWPAEWPRGIPHHGDIMDQFFPYDDALVTASVVPPSMLIKRVSEVNIDTKDFMLFEADMAEILKYVTNNVRSDSPIYLDAADDTYQGTVASYFEDYESRSE